MQIDFDKDLSTYFTDVEHLQQLFRQILAASPLTKPLLVIHGVGGVGKSSLLRMFRLHCKSVHVPVALASGDEQKSALDVLARWADDLKVDGMVLPAFSKTFEHYRAIQAKVDEQARKAQDARRRMADIAGKATSKTAEAAVGALAGAALGSLIPGIGTAIGGVLGGVLGGMGADALVDWLRGFLKQPDIDLLLDPAKKLTDDFLADVERIADKRRIMLMLDTYEQLTALEDRAREVAQRVGQISNLSYGVLLVIAGRAIPNWDRAWPGWLVNAQVEELKPMSEDDMRELVRRYYATIRGGEPNPAQVEAIIRFARGLPMVVTSAVQLWVKYGVEDFQSVKPEIVANLVDRLMEGVPKGLIPALEAAAVVRWFDQPILRAVTGQADVRAVYDELRRFPFVRSRVEGLALHDAVREMMDENLRVQDAERHRELHERTAAYFEKRLEKATGEEAERLGLERLYHRVRADEETGIKLFQEMAEELVRYRLVNRLRALLNDVNTYPLERENSRLWREYYVTRLAHLEFKLLDAVQAYQAIGKNEHAEAKLRAYALCDWGELLLTTWTDKNVSIAENIVKQSMDIGLLDFHLYGNFFSLAKIGIYYGQWDRISKSLNEARHFFELQGDRYGLASTYIEMKRALANLGLWREFFAADRLARENLSKISPEPLLLRANLLGKWARAWALAGRFAECESISRESLAVAQTLQDNVHCAKSLYDLGWSLGVQEKFDEADKCFTESLQIVQQLGETYIINRGITLGHWGLIKTRQGQFKLAAEYLNESLAIREFLSDYTPRAMLELFTWIGLLSEIQQDFQNTEIYYQKYVNWKKYNLYYFQCTALTGLVRVKHALREYAVIPPLLAEAEQLAQHYEYNDHLASLRLTQGHIAWEEKAPSWENGFDAALRYYQLALIHALRYNRFLLDEVLSGRPQGTPLRPIIPSCLARGEEGRRMLIALRDWWQTGVNDIGTPRPDTISPIPEGIPLLEAERIAREREPGDGSPQRSVVEQIEAALQSRGAGYRLTSVSTPKGVLREGGRGN